VVDTPKVHWLRSPRSLTRLESAAGPIRREYSVKTLAVIGSVTFQVIAPPRPVDFSPPPGWYSLKPEAAASLALTGEMFDTAESLRNALGRSRIRDAESGRTNAGPHLTDLATRHTQKRADARECSTGEQKALLISIMLAFARELARTRDGLAPLLLLDEIAAHLDAVRRAALFEEIADLSAQAWMTGTDLSLFEGARAQIFAVEDGRFREAGA